MENSCSDIEVLISGNSESFYGINPEYISYSCFNSAQVSQSLDIDCLLLEKYIGRMPNLKAVIIPVTYTSFFEVLGYGEEIWRIPNYTRYLDFTPIYDKKKIIKALSFYLCNDIEKFTEYYLKGNELNNSSALGFGTDYRASGSLRDMKSDALKATERHLAATWEYVSLCRSNLCRMLDIAQKQDVKVILITPPLHEYYRAYINKKQSAKMHEILNEILDEYENVKYVDFSDNKNFLNTDFYDSNHLNDIGAKKLSVELNVILADNLSENLFVFR